MCERGLGHDEVDAPRKVELLEERARERHRVDGARDVVAKTRQAEFAGGRATARPPVAFEDVDGEPGARQRHGRGETVGSGADHCHARQVHA